MAGAGVISKAVCLLGPQLGLRIETLSLGFPSLLGLPYIMVAEMEKQACQER